MKQIISLATGLMLAFVLLAGCGTASSGSAAYGSPNDYKTVLEDARPDELNSLDMYAVVTGPNDALHDTFFNPAFGLSEDVMEKYAISMGTIITIAYGVAIILPVEGHQQDVIDQLQGFVATQQRAMENYLQDQYEIASSAIIKTVPTGEVLLAMCEDAETVMKAMEDGLKA